MKKWTSGYVHSASQDSVMERYYPTKTGGYIHSASQDSIMERYNPSRTGGYAHGVIHECSMACPQLP